MEDKIYNEEEVFENINEFLNNDKEDIEKAYEIHNKLKTLVPVELREKSFYRYLPLGGTIGLNMNNYKIYEYHHEKRESFRLIYPEDKVESLKEVGLEPVVDFKFVSIPCVLLEVPLEDFDSFTDREWDNFKEALIIASEGKPREGNIRNIDIKW